VAGEHVERLINTRLSEIPVNADPNQHGLDLGQRSGRTILVISCIA
jgi:hypothetical protein